MTRDDLQQLAVSWLQAFNYADWGRCRELFASEVTCNVALAAGMHEYIGDTDSTLAIFQEVKGISPDLMGTISGWIVDEGKGTAIAMVTWTGTDASGRKAEVPGALLVTTVDGRISKIREYIDAAFCPCLIPAP